MNMPLILELSVPGSVEIDGMTVFVDEGSKTTKISAGQQNRNVEVDFLPGFPNLLDISDRSTERGRWSFRISGAVITGGSYNLSRKGNSIAVEIDVTENWEPSGLPLSFRIFTQLVRSFRSWPITYRWRGTVDLGENLTLVGAWERKGRQ